MKRKTYTSTEVKARWNQAHYDSITFAVPKGAGDEITAVAKAKGMSRAAYIRHLILADNPETAENGDMMPIFRTGGGGYSMTLEQYLGEVWKLSEQERNRPQQV